MRSGVYSKRKQINNLLFVVFTAVAAASGLSLAMLYYYNPPGAYLAKNVLLAPENAFTLQYSIASAKGKPRYVFDTLQLSYFDAKEKKQRIIDVPQEAYARFYNLVENASSLTASDQDVERQFSRGRPAVLTLKVKVEGGTAPQGLEAVFSEVDFAEGGDYFRVQLRQHGTGGGWAYYQHPGIYGKALAIFTGVPP